MATTLIRNAQAIVTVDREDRVLRNGNILVQDNVIRYIGPEERPADRVIDASHCFVYPGLVNTHHHLYQTFTRNLPKVQKMELFPWLRTLYEIWRCLDEDCIYYSSLVGLGELLKYGCTTCMDHHYVFPKVGSEHFIDQQFRAADLFLLNVDLLELAGAKLDPACMLGTVGYARPAELVMVNGRVVVEHGRVLGMDEEQTRVRAQQLVDGMLQKAE